MIKTLVVDRPLGGTLHEGMPVLTLEADLSPRLKLLLHLVHGRRVEIAFAPAVPEGMTLSEAQAYFTACFNHGCAINEDHGLQPPRCAKA